MENPQVGILEVDRRRLRWAVWLMVLAAVLALVGIFGFGAFTGAGGYFDEATTDAAVRDFYWQIWGILLPLAVATVISGISLLMLAGVLAQLGRGWTAALARVAQWVVVPATVLASLPYWMGPEIDDLDLPTWLAGVSGVAGVISYAAVVALGVAILGLPLPKWTGVMLILGALAAFVTFLPLFVFVGTLASGIGILRWDHKRLDSMTDASTIGA